MPENSDFLFGYSSHFFFPETLSQSVSSSPLNCGMSQSTKPFEHLRFITKRSLQVEPPPPSTPRAAFLPHSWYSGTTGRSGEASTALFPQRPCSSVSALSVSHHLALSAPPTFKATVPHPYFFTCHPEQFHHLLYHITKITLTKVTNSFPRCS